MLTFWPWPCDLWWHKLVARCFRNTFCLCLFHKFSMLLLQSTSVPLLVPCYATASQHRDKDCWINFKKMTTKRCSNIRNVVQSYIGFTCLLKLVNMSSHTVQRFMKKKCKKKKLAFLGLDTSIWDKFHKTLYYMRASVIMKFEQLLAFS